MKIPYLNPDRAPRMMDTKFVDYEPDLILDFGDSIRVDFPDGTVVILNAGWNHEKLQHAALMVYEDTDKNPVLSYHRQTGGQQ